MDIFITSQNAAGAFRGDDKKIPLYAVGVKTSEVLQDKGFTNILMGHGDASSLLEKIQKTVPKNHRLVHLSGDEISVDVSCELKKFGYTCHRQIIYKTKYLDAFSPEALRALRGKDLFSILFYSPRSAQIFKKSIQKYHLETPLKTVYALSLSPGIETYLKDLPWKGSFISQAKSTVSMIESLDLLRSKCHNALK